MTTSKGTVTHGSTRPAPGRARRRALAAVTAGALLTLAGCGMGDSLTERALEEVVERASDGEVTIDVDPGDGTSELTITDDEGGTTTIGTGSEVPAAFAQAVDLPTSLEVAAVTEVEDDGTTTYSVVGTVATGSMDDLLVEVDAGITGWTVQEGSEGVYSQVAEMEQRVLQRGDEFLMVLVMSEDASTGPHQVSYLWSPNPQG